MKPNEGLKQELENQAKIREQVKGWQNGVASFKIDRPGVAGKRKGSLPRLDQLDGERTD